MDEEEIIRQHYAKIGSKGGKGIKLANLRQCLLSRPDPALLHLQC
ncbi:MAG: hypothetical protein PF495_21145 [Spirochaetales bacterium]|nr:hypothetical protein [Spirochaetales bacterium]